MSNAKERYQTNRARVFEIYGIDPHDRRYNCHHVHHRAHGGSDEKENLIPTPKRLHELFHREGTDRQAIHDFCDEEYGGDPYQEGQVLYQAAPRRKPQEKKQRSFEEWLLRGLER